MIFLSADLSQIESRIALAYTGDPRMLEIARAMPWEHDQHTQNAALIFACSENEVSKEKRYLGKKAVHAATRGARGRKLSEELLKDGYIKSPEECDHLIDTYLAHHPARTVVEAVLVSCVELAATSGLDEVHLGEGLAFWHLNSSRPQTRAVLEQLYDMVQFCILVDHCGSLGWGLRSANTLSRTSAMGMLP